MTTYKVEVINEGTFWYKEGTDELHKKDGPAIECLDGSKYWYLNGKCHRKDGPAIEWANGTKYWCLNGKFHREDGPAVESSDGDESWFLNGKSLSEKKWKQQVENCEGEVVVVKGVEYFLRRK